MVIGAIVHLELEDKDWGILENNIMLAVLEYLITKDFIKLHDDFDKIDELMNVSSLPYGFYDIFNDPQTMINEMIDYIYCSIGEEVINKLRLINSEVELLELGNNRIMIKLILKE